MAKVFLQKVFANLALIFFISSFSFFLIHLIPGDPVDFILKEGASLEDRELLRSHLGLDRHLFMQYFLFIKQLLHLDFGSSLHTGESVFLLLKSQLPFTLALTLFSLSLACSFALPLALFSVRFPSRFVQSFFDNFPVFLFSIPVFVSAPCLIAVFSLYFPLLPVSGSGSFSHLILPAVSLALPLGAILLKITRTSLLEVYNEDYIRTARAKGLPEKRIYFKHVLFNALIPVVTILGLQMGALLTGTVIVEVIFDRPGLGELLYSAIVTRDYPIVQACILLISLIYISVNRLTDKIYVWIQPSMKEGNL